MNKNNLNWIYEFSQHHSDQHYWESIFSLGDTNNHQSFYFIKKNQIFPPRDVYVRINLYLFEIELPGNDIDAVSIVPHKNSIELRGNYCKLQENCTNYLMERSNRHFHKIIEFPSI